MSSVSSGRNNDNNDNDNNGTLGMTKRIDTIGGGGKRGSSNCNGNVRSADSGMRIGGKWLIPIPRDFPNSPLSLLPLSSASVPASSFPTTAKAGEKRRRGISRWRSISSTGKRREYNIRCLFPRRGRSGPQQR